MRHYFAHSFPFYHWICTQWFGWYVLSENVLGGFGVELAVIGKLQ